jgi:hypothetical protein
MLPLAAFPMHCYPAARCNSILPFSSKWSRLPNPLVRGGMATPVGATGSKVRLACYSGTIGRLARDVLLSRALAQLGFNSWEGNFATVD